MKAMRIANRNPQGTLVQEVGFVHYLLLYMICKLCLRLPAANVQDCKIPKLVLELRIVRGRELLSKIVFKFEHEISPRLHIPRPLRL